MKNVLFAVYLSLLVGFSEAYVPTRLNSKISTPWREKIGLSKRFRDLSPQESPSHPLKMSDAAISTDTKKSTSLWDVYLKVTDTLTVLFPLWTVLFAGIALKAPEKFAWFTTKYFTGALGALMLSMGITLTIEDFQRVTKQPLAVIIGFVLCYGMMPLLGLYLGKAFNLPMDLVAGIVLVG